jgi:surface-anchored protein
MERIDRGVTLTLLDVQGPGALIVYLQSGDFAAPDVLWDSEGSARPAWVDVNTHTHANWVFSAPGAYLARVRVEADLIDGTTVSDTRELRFAVGPRSAVDESFAASWSGAADDAAGAGATGADGTDAGAAAAQEQDDGSGAGGLVAVIALVAAALAVVLAVALVRGAGAKRRARAGARGDERAGDVGGSVDGPGASR